MPSSFKKFSLLPFSWLYGFGVEVRNILFDLGLLPAYRAGIPVISIGNLSVGGTGKTPHVEYVVRLLSRTHTCAVLSRGYKRNTIGFRWITPTSQATEVGDEPLQIYRKFEPNLISAVAEKRVLGIKNIISAHPDCDVIILDDAFQHRHARPDLNIVLTDYSQPFYRDVLLPAGRLREPRRRARRADLIIITKCPDDIDEATKLSLLRQTRRHVRAKTPILFSGVRHGRPQPILPLGSPILPGPNVTLITGIANPGLIKEYVSTQYNLVTHLVLEDHYKYNAPGLQTLLSEKNKPEGHFFLTTEKDMVKWMSPELAPLLEGKPVYYLPFEIYFLDKQHQFDQFIFQTVNRHA